MGFCWLAWGAMLMGWALATADQSPLAHRSVSQRGLADQPQHHTSRPSLSPFCPRTPAAMHTPVMVLVCYCCWLLLVTATSSAPQEPDAAVHKASRRRMQPQEQFCDFSSGTTSFCAGLWETVGGDFLWTQVPSGGTPTGSTGPSEGPHGGSYVYTESSGDNYPHKVAYLVSADGAYHGITFWYSMYGWAIGNVSVETQARSRRWTTAWTRSGQQHFSRSRWSNATVFFPTVVNKVRFIAFTGESYTSDIAISDVRLLSWTGTPTLTPTVVPTATPLPTRTLTLTPTATPRGPFCDFASSTGNSFCGGMWETQGGDFNWTQSSGGETPTSGTGPDAGPRGGAYVFTEASDPNSPNKVAYLMSREGGYHGISFWYHMYGFNMGTLSVEVQGLAGAWTVVWARSGQQHTSWRAAWTSATVAFTKVAGRVRFVGLTGDGVRSDMAISDVEVLVWSGTPSPTPTTVPTATPLPTPTSTATATPSPLGAFCNFLSSSPGPSGNGTYFCGRMWHTFGGNFEWTQMSSGRTPGYSTGPDSGPGSSNGGFNEAYVFTDSRSPNYPHKTAYLVSHSGAFRGIKFWYHMYGWGMGNLSVETEGASGLWRPVWLRSEQQHSFYTTPWSSASLVFTKSVRKVRFKAVTGSSRTSDMAVSDVQLLSWSDTPSPTPTAIPRLVPTATLVPTLTLTPTKSPTPTARHCSNAPPDWADSHGDDCTKYVTHLYCTSSGGYGPGWDAAFGTFESRAVGGIDAVGACCGCGGGGPPRAPTRATCRDEPPLWRDSGNFDCAHYGTSRWCTPAKGYGSGWSPSWGAFADFSVAGVSATDACCLCGGGATGTATPSPTESSTRTATPVPTASGTPTASDSLGNTSTPVPTPTPLPSGTPTPSVSARPSFGPVYTFGSNTFGQLGFPADQLPHPDPRLLALPHGEAVTAVALGGTLGNMEGRSAVVAGGRLFLFGDWHRAHFPGDDAAANPPHHRPRTPSHWAACWASTHDWVPSHEVTAFATGPGEHDAFIARGEVYTFGVLSSNSAFQTDFGQLGRLSRLSIGACAHVPQRVPVPASLATSHNVSRAAAAVAVGRFHTAILTTSGHLLMLGRTWPGQLGIGDYSAYECSLCDPTPEPFRGVMTPTLVAFPEPIAAVALGNDHSAFVARARAYTFGGNLYGQLCLGLRMQDVDLERRTPQRVDLPGPVSALALGVYTSAFVAGGRLYTCGDNEYGQLGVGDVTDRNTPQLVPAPNGAPVTAVAAAWRTTAFIAGGHVFLFGRNDLGQLGLGHRRPVRVPERLVPRDARAVRLVALGPLHGAIQTVATDTPTPTPTAVPTATASPSRSATHTPTDSATPSATGSRTRSRTASPSRSHTPSRSPSPTGSPTPSRSRSPSPSRTASPTASPTPFPTRPPTPSPTPTRSAASTRTPSPRATPTPTASPSPTLASTGTASPTATAAGTPTQTGTATPAPTATPSATDTAVLPRCGNSTGAGGVASFVVASAGQCIQGVSLGPGSTSMRRSSLLLRIRQLTGGALLARVAQGCSVQGPGCPDCSGCIRRYDAVSFPGEDLLPVAAVPDVRVLLMYQPTAAAPAARSRAVRAQATAVDAELVVVYTASAMLYVIVCCGIAGAVALVVLAGCCRTGCAKYREVPDKPWERNPRLDRFGARLWIFAGALALVFGLGLFLTATLSSHRSSRPGALQTAALALAAAGALVLVPIGLWALRDPEQMHCPECAGPTSRWRCRGTYVPADTPQGFAKAHTAHVRCVLCGRPVVLDRWAGSPPGRVYHNECWRAHCELVVSQPHFAPQWMERHCDTVTDTELTHMLLATIQGSARDSLDRMLAKVPLSRFSIPDTGRTALHEAVAIGNLEMLSRLLALQGTPVDPYCPPDPGAEPSVVVQGLGPGSDDVYLRHPIVKYNGRAVYVGHAHGKYVYYFQPPKERDPGSGPAAPAGWCLASYLGDGSPAFRLPLPVTDPDAPVDSVSGSPRQRGGTLKKTKSVWKRMKSSMFPSGSDSHSTAQDETEPLTPWPGDVDPWLAGAGDASNPTSPGAAAHPDVKLLSLSDVRLQWVPHATSLLQEAVQAGAADIIQHLIGLYQSAYPDALVWEYCASPGLWQTYPPEVLAELQTAVVAGAPAPVTVPIGGLMVTIDVRGRRHATAAGTVPLRRRFRPMFQYRSADGEVAGVVSDPARVPDWGRAAVLSAPCNLVACAASPDVLALLCAEGVADVTLWELPCKSSAALAFARDEHERMLDDTAQWMLADVLGAEAGSASVNVPQALALQRRRRRQRRSAPQTEIRGGGRETGIGSRLEDGLGAPVSDAGTRSLFYGRDYSNGLGVLPFCIALPDNDIGLRFHLPPVLGMAADTIMKVCVSPNTRRAAPLAPRYGRLGSGGPS